MIGCTTVDHRSNLHSVKEQEMTVGKVQKEIRVGMSGAQVAEALGSPNIVTKDDGGDETWVYDKIATEASYSENSSGLFIILYGSSSRSGAAATTQRTLTVVIKFDASSKVKSFSYHASKF
ncbi:MAG: outer membrane protein assembly factor BamE [Ignavibacteria bacterium]|nr:outer membrane protein assembly factor BamE [Ignavibacteria bacterium]